MLIIDVNGKGREMNPDGWFKHVFDENLIVEDEFAKKMIKEVSQCKVIGPNLVVSDILGPVSPEWIGSGVKAVLAMKYADKSDGIINIGKWCGDNLVPYIREVVDSKDVTVHCERFFPIFNQRCGGPYNGKVMIKNSGKICTNGLDMYNEMHKFFEECSKDER